MPVALSLSRSLSLSEGVPDRGALRLRRVVTAPYCTGKWHKLVRASVLDYLPAVDGFLRIRNPLKLLERAAGRAPQELAFFACYFLPGLSESRCAGAFARRPRPFCCSPIFGDVSERRFSPDLPAGDRQMDQGTGAATEPLVVFNEAFLAVVRYRLGPKLDPGQI